ncbi:MAG: hypothetical protein NXH97_17715 [Rhodobacteraceae bacterium]|nr:hypothetical protein [Paracoccaceae bacterium]
MVRLLFLLLSAGPLAAQDNAAPAAAPSTVVIERPATPLLDALGQAADPPVCCQLSDGCSPGTDGTRPAEVRSLCLASNGQPLTGQYCHKDGACRP